MIDGATYSMWSRGRGIAVANHPIFTGKGLVDPNAFIFRIILEPKYVD